MDRNIGTPDRILRLTLGIALLAYAWWQQSVLALALAVFTFYEVFSGWCALFALTGRSSCPVNYKDQTTDKDQGNHMIDAKRLALAGGILWGLSIFIMTAVSIYTGYASKALALMADVYPGYTVSWPGALTGLGYGFIDAFFGLLLLALIYNKLGTK